MDRLARLMLSMGIPTLRGSADQSACTTSWTRRVCPTGQGVRKGGADRTGTGASGDHDRLGLQRAGGSGRGAAGGDRAGTGRPGERQSGSLGNVFTLLCVFTIGVMAVFYAAEKPFLYLVGASDATYPYASAYLRIYLIGTFFVQIVLGLNPFITAQGQSKTAMGSVLIGAAFNIILDPIFIFVIPYGGYRERHLQPSCHSLQEQFGYCAL